MSIIANWHLQIIKSCIDPKVQDNEQNFKTVLVDEWDKLKKYIC